MSGYYGNPSDYDARGIDYDLDACLEYNPPVDEPPPYWREEPKTDAPRAVFSVDDIERVLAVIEGENDSADWHWVIALRDGSFVYAVGGCDYTGWDCVSSACYRSFPSAERAADCAGGWFAETLHKQLIDGRGETWRRKKDREFGLR